LNHDARNHELKKKTFSMSHIKENLPTDDRAIVNTEGYKGVGSGLRKNKLTFSRESGSPNRDLNPALCNYESKDQNDFIADRHRPSSVGSTYRLFLI